MMHMRKGEKPTAALFEYLLLRIYVSERPAPDEELTPETAKRIYARILGLFDFYWPAVFDGVSAAKPFPKKYRNGKAVLVPAPQPGRCRICGCTETDPCGIQRDVKTPDGISSRYAWCAWADQTKTLCTNARCLREAERVRPTPAAGPSSRARR